MKRSGIECRRNISCSTLKYYFLYMRGGRGEGGFVLKCDERYKEIVIQDSGGNMVLFYHILA